MINRAEKAALNTETDSSSSVGTRVPPLPTAEDYAPVAEHDEAAFRCS